MLNESPVHPFAEASGQWTGFHNEGTPGVRRRLDVLLKFQGKELSGVGDDESGMFVLSGAYDPEEHECRWVQTYLFGRTLFYRGFCDEERIWGVWRDAGDEHGGFQIWPLNRPAPGALSAAPVGAA